MRQKPIHPALQPYLEGQVILLNKPLHWTSFDTIRKIRKITGVNKVGHAGTLDPLATGLLIICTGKFTKRINEFMAQRKVYTGTITIGASTPTYDLESDPENFTDYSFVSEDLLKEKLQDFTGEILQTPPIHSAIKQEGKPVYLAARKGDEVKLEPRPITIYDFKLSNVTLPNIDFEIACSTGTYIRSIANDYGAALGTGGYLSKLCRTQIGEFTLEEAVSMEEFEEKILALKNE
ncbi:MAG: tRNA pseudouridine(55) synthase TruB [Pseudopedobacter saltans]|uniref:tRNA pseudouridine synthase B n=1 Tax=Pseudopedobacter saltans TaxID=151895 RepID=A0A2W5F9X4_9SPHI|nr:MAG: tRNA pseudouridine(55) synthase TruB [Pseudopedobacter saltans]